MKYITLNLPEERIAAGWKQRLAHELIDYGINFLYLAIVFAAFTWYRRLILAEYHITYLHYWVAVVEALLFAKLIMVGDLLHLGREFEQRPLIYSTLYKTVVFSIFVGLFGILEATVEGLLHEKGLAGGFQKLMREGKNELLARSLLTFCAFFFFFAFKDLARVLGKRNIRALFFRKRVTTESDPELTGVQILARAGSLPPHPSP